MYGGDGDDLPAQNIERSRDWFEWFKDHPFAKIIEADGGPVGHVRLHSLNAQDRKARLAIGLFAEADLGQGLGRRAVRLTLDHAFENMSLHRVDLRALSYNQRAIRCYLACGFVHEGTERDAALVGGEWHDDWIMSILETEYRQTLPQES
jgi:RimJ/RimL family protein N-acetyltransferase